MKRGLMLVSALMVGVILAGSAYASDRFELTDDRDTFIDTRTGLEWSRCRYGDEWTGKKCSIGSDGQLTVKERQAKQAFSYGKHDDWRVPSVDELKTLIFCDEGEEQTAFKKTEKSGVDKQSRGNYIVGYDRENCSTYHQTTLAEFILSTARTSDVISSTMDDEVDTHSKGRVASAWMVNLNTGHYYRWAVNPNLGFKFFLVRDR